MSDDEAARIEEILGRPPNDLELAMYAVMWSEHCSYKSSRLHLKRLPTEGPHVLVGPGENAGVIDAGDGIAVALRIESHNHPSAVEPYQGAATGVGGILRDIFTMGARPIALMDPLFFGTLDDARTRWLTEGVVAGISGYGNSVGVPTIGGELTFAAGYARNPLVNVLCLGVMPNERLVLGAATGEGNLAVLLGSTTGRDGIGGVSVLASAAFGADGDGGIRRRDAKRPSVQVGDPFEEKRLIEACLELLDRGLVVGIQDLGGAGPHLRHLGDRGTRRHGHGRRRRRRPPARAGHGALRGDDLREPGAHARHRHPRRPRRGGGGVPALGGAGHGHRHRDRRRPPAHPRPLTATVLADVPAASLSDDAPLYDRPRSAPADLDERRRDDPGRRAGRATVAPERPRRRRAGACWPTPRGSTASTTTSSSSTPWSARARTPRCCAWPHRACRPATGDWPSPPTPIPAGARSTPVGARP